MTREGIIRRIGARMPRRLRGLRGRLLLEAYEQNLGVEEVTCPACGGACMIGGEEGEPCPICRGFGDVPAAVAQWFDDEMLREATSDTRRSPAASQPADDPGGMRYGLAAEVKYRISGADSRWAANRLTGRWV
jgi:hypothetical protein